MQTKGVIRFIGQSPGIRRALELCEVVAKEMVTVLLRGETGVGKELLARRIHGLSARAQHDFVVMNCPAITATIAESELFGHEKGSFTGAVVSGEGLLAAADGGSLFMDEVGDLDKVVQLKLLRFLNGSDERTREVRRVGSPKTKPVNVRIIAATNQNLLDLMQKGIFREDLYYRLNPFIIHIPPLRTRKMDIPPLVEHLLKGFKVEEEVMNKLLGHSWPGNVRELESVLRSAKMLASHRKHAHITLDDIWFATELEEGKGPELNAATA